MQIRGISVMRSRRFLLPAIVALLLASLPLAALPSAIPAVRASNSATTPQLTRPADQATTTDTTPTFAWKNVSGATAYRIEIGTDPTFVEVVHRHDLKRRIYTLREPLTEGVAYLWRVGVIGRAGTIVWSDARTLTIGHSPSSASGKTPSGDAGVAVAAISPTATNTASPTRTPTATRTAAATASPIPSKTPTRTPTVAPSKTPTRTPTTAPTKTPTVALTPTKTPTVKPTSSPTSTKAATATRTATKPPTAVPTMTATKTRTPVPFATATNTGTPTRTPLATATRTPTRTPVATATASRTAIPTSSSTATTTTNAVQTPTATASPTPPAAPSTSTSTATATASATNTATPTSDPSPTATATPTPTGTSTPTATNAITPTTSGTSTATVSPSGTATATATDTPTMTPTATATTPPVVGGIARNPSFENGQDYWYLESGTDVITGKSHGGDHAVELASAGGYADQHLTLSAGNTYQLSAWGKIDGANDTGYIGVAYRDALGQRLSSLEPPMLAYTQANYTQQSMTFTVPANASSVAVFAWKRSGASDFLVDDVFVVVEVQAAPTPVVTPVSGACQRLLALAYFYPPTGMWDTLISGGSGVNLVVLNIDSGPSTSHQDIYDEPVANARAAGMLVIGYIRTLYGTRDPQEVIAEMDRYHEWYGLTSFFLDEADTDAISIPLYQQMADHAHALGGIAVLNFGYRPDHAYIDVGDILIVFESPLTTFDNYTLPDWIAQYPANKFGEIVYNVPADQVDSVLARTQASNIGYVWVTDDPYDRGESTEHVLPSYWTSLNQKIEASCT